MCRAEHQPNIVVECHNPHNRFHLQKAGASEIVSSDSLGLRLLARSALFHGMTQFYQELLTVRRDNNEVFPAAGTRGFDWPRLRRAGEMFMKYRNDRRSCLLIGIQRGDEMMINPIGDEAGPLRPDDQLILLSRTFPGGRSHYRSAGWLHPPRQEKNVEMNSRLPRVVADTPLNATIEGLLRDRVEILPWTVAEAGSDEPVEGMYTYGHVLVDGAMLDRLRWSEGYQQLRRGCRPHRLGGCGGAEHPGGKHAWRA